MPYREWVCGCGCLWSPCSFPAYIFFIDRVIGGSRGCDGEAARRRRTARRGGDRSQGGGRPRGHERQSISRIGQSVEVQQPNYANVTRTCGSYTAELQLS